jgi:hypothetical protein
MKGSIHGVHRGRFREGWKDTRIRHSCLISDGVDGFGIFSLLYLHRVLVLLAESLPGKWRDGIQD